MPFGPTEAAPEAKPAPDKNEHNNFDGSVASLIRRYRTHEQSPYKKIRHRSRRNYESHLGRLERDIGSELVKDIDAERIKTLYALWSDGQHFAIASALVVMLRGLTTFGVTSLGSRDCRELRFTLSEMKFEGAKPRTERLTTEQVKAIISKAHEMELHSIALAQAFQHDLTLSQRDVIGEWVPLSEPGTSDVIHNEQKWLRGLRWSEIDDNMVLRHTPSKGQQDFEVDLKLAPMVMEELARFGGTLPTSGPAVVSDNSGRPWVDDTFRKTWRKIADSVGIPKSIRNMDTKSKPAARVGNRPAPPLLANKTGIVI